MIELFPHGFEEVEHADGIELVAYTDAGGEERLWKIFGHASARDVADGWEERWREFHRPTRVGQLWIGQPWQEPPADALAVVIDPGRAFGTGAHPTTRLCLELLAEVERGSLLDVGCGSGVVAIAAAKLGFAPVLAVDLDEHAVDAAGRNARANGVAVDVRQLDAVADEPPAADVAVVNVTRDAVEAVARWQRWTLLTTSGYLAHEQPAIEGYRHLDRRVESGWAADLFER